MPHEMGHCNCGRQIHFPCTAGFGDQWRCYNCGTVWTLTNRGGSKPLYRVGSRRPAPPKTKVVVIRDAPRLGHQQRQLPAPRRGGLLSWLFGS